METSTPAASTNIIYLSPADTSNGAPETHYLIKQVSLAGVTPDTTTPDVPLILQVEGSSTPDSSTPEASYSLHLKEEADVVGDFPALERFMDVIMSYKCRFCPFVCVWKSGLMSHLRSCHLEEAVLLDLQDPDDPVPAAPLPQVEEPCVIAPTIVAPPSVAAAAEEEEKVQEFYMCGQCHTGFDTLEECRVHMEQVHNAILEEHSSDKEEQPKKSTPNAPTKVKRRAKREILADRPYRCQERGCGYRFTTEANLQYHSQCHHGAGQKPFQCLECHQGSFEHWRSLAMHLWRDHGMDIDLHTCEVCGYKIHSLFKLKNHKRIHSDERSFVCETCGKAFKQLGQLRNHSVIHLDRQRLPERRWYSPQTCPECGRNFADTKCLRKHQLAVHRKARPYVCTICGHTCSRKAMLRLHLRQHTGEKPFACTYCDYRTGDHNSLRRHKMRHTGSKSYKCPYCEYACIQAISYKSHLKNKHPGKEGLYSCFLCQFKSVSKDNYANHMSEHGIVVTAPAPAHLADHLYLACTS